jgi:hypothetical protein
MPTFLLAISAPAAVWTDRSEYDLALTVRAEAAPKKKLELLDQWKAKYPKTELSQMRRELYLSTYQALGDNAKMLDVTREILAEQPGSLVGLYWCVVLLPSAKDTSPELLSIGEKAADRLLTGTDRYFDVSRKPAAMTAEAWQAQKASTEFLARRSAGWIRWQRGDLAGAEKDLNRCVDQNPKAAEISAWLGTVTALQKQPEKQPTALWHLARAGEIRGEGAVPETQQRQINSLLERLYLAYHGEPQGLDELRVSAASAPFPPSDFKIESAASVANRKRMDELERSNPELAAWLRMKQKLESPEGDKYFTESVRINPLPKLKGILIRSSPPKKPMELVLALSDDISEEVLLKLSTPLPNEAERGTRLSFEGTAESFTQKPLKLIVNGTREKLEGWPQPEQR